MTVAPLKTWCLLGFAFFVGSVTGTTASGLHGQTPSLAGSSSDAPPLVQAHTPIQEWSQDQKDVWGTLQSLWRTSTALDLDAWFAMVSDRYRGWSITDEGTRGKAVWRERAMGRFSAPRRVHYRLNPVAVDVHGDMAITYSHYAAITRSEDGALSTSRGQWTDVFRKEGSEWKLVADAGGETSSSPEILVSTEWLAQRLERPDLVVLQVESQAERYTEGHIPGAVFLPYQGIAWDGPGEEGAEFLPFQGIEETLENLGLDGQNHIVVYGSNPLLATRLWLTLDIMGVGTRLSLLDGGLPAWTEEGRPLSTDLPLPVPQGELTLDPASEIVVTADWILETVGDPGLALLDSRSEEEYTGEGQEGESVGHLPGAGNASWLDLIESREIPRLRPVEELAAAFHRGGVDPGETVVPYCVVGLRAGMDFFVARLLGYESRYYDGSWRDWTNRGLPLTAGGDPG